MADPQEEQNPSSSTAESADDGQETIKLGDIIKHQDEMMEEVAAVLGAGDDFNCSYANGYMKRQALYACLTCVPQGKDDFTKAAGFCLACSYHCHDGHNLIELYTKRHFRCDCGNLKFTDFPCNLNANKADYNYENIYNQNFSGLYCTCSKPYPDPEDTIEDDMIQCIICEDWYHSRHLNVPAVDDFAEMICEQCVRENDFLLNYIGLAIIKIAQNTGDENVSVAETVSDEKQGESGAEQVNGDKKCKKPVAKIAAVPQTLFMRELSWRQQLCSCENCMAVYKENKVEFLLDMEDTVEFYETKGKQKYVDAQKQALEVEQHIIKGMPRAPLLDAIAEYKDFQGQLSEFLKGFADNQKVVTVSDVKEFFATLKNNKRLKTGETTYFCR